MTQHKQELLWVNQCGSPRHEKKYTDTKDITEVKLKRLGDSLDGASQGIPTMSYVKLSLIPLGHEFPESKTVYAKNKKDWRG